ncbi:phosphatidylcholine and lysophosphatidylcholine phospholipase [Vanrija albida]|uniref:Lysophospholipase NTE1 n=1 Tax=Vanrija albida TaxID=181172 RepID=A0ABR3QFL1_9TREE
MPRLAITLAAVASLTAAAAHTHPDQPHLPQHSQHPPPITSSNPLVALAGAVVGGVLYILQLTQYIVGVVTITVPTMIVRMLQYSFTISLGFPHFAALFIGLAGALFALIRYRYLTQYTKLKESALPLPSPTSLANTLPLINDAALNDPSNRSTNVLHSYLDDFLSAIRIFGYLERPVFHELSRHLQTRRLAAGDTIEIGGGEFWCVVEGRVQVFAPNSGDHSPSLESPDPFETTRDSFNGYSLVNEVSTGGTLSSLFSILSLFTEHIKLTWNEDAPEPPASSLFAEERPRSRANSDVSQLDGKTMGSSSSTEVAPQDGPRPPSSPSTSTVDGTIRQSSSSPEINRLPLSAESSHPSTSTHSPMFGPLSGMTSLKPPQLEHQPGSRGSGSSRHRQQTPLESVAMKGTIARATVDSTLAVIPAEAFRKLTRKFPKAAGSIVQVVLERFSRVTFMTAHKFLGLTREILRSESALNSLVSHPLPRSFYSGGGMQALRERFQPELRPKRQPFPNPEHSPARSILGGPDYFNFESPSPTVRAPSLPSVTPKNIGTPATKPTSFKGIGEGFSKLASDSEDTVDEVLSPTTPHMLLRRNSAMRNEVAAGDLAMAGQKDSDGFFRPRFPRIDTWRGRTPTSSLNDRRRTSAYESEDDDDYQFQLRDELVKCIAKSIGILQPPDQPGDSRGNRSIAASLSISTPNSPAMFPNGRPHGRSPFGNVLDMANASQDRGNISGLLRESLLNARLGVDDDVSSVSASIHDSHGGAMDVNTTIMRDLGNHLDILYFKKGSVLVKQGERAAGLYYVIDGFLDVSIPTQTPGDPASANILAADLSSANLHRPFGAALGIKDPEAPNKGKTPSKKSPLEGEEVLYTVKPGGLAGYLASLCSTESYVNISAKTDCYVGFLPHNALERILERRPIVLLTLAKRMLSLLSPLILHIDAGLDWIQLNAGQNLYEKGDPATDFFIIINGRLRAIDKKPNSDNVSVIREYGQNDPIGELDVILGAPRSDTVQAIRETELVRIPTALFDAVSIKHPATTMQFMKLIVGEVRKAVNQHQSEFHQINHHASGTANELRADRNLKTVCIMGSNRDAPVAQFAAKLKTALEDIGSSTSYLDQATVIRHLGRHAFTRMGALKIAGWLADQEQHYEIVLYVADTSPSSQWTMTCIRQADLVLVLGAGDDPQLGEYEKLLLAMKCYARKELILLHDERAVPPGSTRLWLKNRPWLQAHYHVELPGVAAPLKSGSIHIHDPAAVAAFKHLREKVETRIKQYRGLRPLGRPRRPHHLNDFARIARRLTGRQIGLVLSGGGARGISHIGMLQALEEHGVPIDAIAGCSIGSLVGGLYARKTDILETTGRAKQFAGRMGSMLRILSDVTYPFVAYTTGHEFNRGIYKAFYNTHIEDFWIPFFANSTNITHSRMEIHRSGYAWRYVRASMTLAGFLPPLSDNGELLVDGGYMDNTPIGPLRASGIRDVIVVDVGSIDDTSPRNYGDSVSGWWLFFNRWNPFYNRSVLSMTEISSRLTYVSSVKTLEDVKSDPRVLYMAMPVQHIETIGGFKQFPQVLDIGLKAARTKLDEWEKDGRLPHGVSVEKKPALTRRGTRIRRSSI